MLTEGREYSDLIRKCLDAISSATNGSGQVNLVSHFQNQDNRRSLGDYMQHDLGVPRNEFAEMNWQDFKDKLIEEQSKLGFEWERVAAQYGPIKLGGFSFPARVGEELALSLEQHNRKSGDFKAILKSEFSNLYDFTVNADIRIGWQDALEAFKSVELQDGRESFVFRRGGSPKFRRKVKDFEYENTESELGQEIADDLKAYLDLTVLEHCQASRGYGRYENADFQGFRVLNNFDHDGVSMHAFELKHNNRVEKVSEAINQALNYRQRAHYVWIVIPEFNESAFPDERRLKQLIEMCKANGVGVISINFKRNSYSGLTQMLAAQKFDPDDHGDLVSLLRRHQWEKCPLCRRIVEKSEERRGCGWWVPMREGQECMKILLESNLVHALDEDLYSGGGEEKA